MIVVSEEELKVGSSSTVILDTKYAGLAGLLEWRIYYKLGDGATSFKPATVVETTKLSSEFEPTDLTRKANLRTWTWARGSGTIILKGWKTFVIPVIAEDE